MSTQLAETDPQVTLEPDRELDGTQPVADALAAYALAQWRWIYGAEVSAWHASRDDAIAEAHKAHPGVAIG